LNHDATKNTNAVRVALVVHDLIPLRDWSAAILMADCVTRRTYGSGCIICLWPVRTAETHR
jgi:hypothetical protein